MALGAWLRFRHIDGMGLWYDEMALWLYTLTGVPPTPLEPPLMSWVLLGAMWLARSVAPLVVHLTPAVIGVLTIPVLYWCGVSLGRDRVSGWTAAALLTLSPMAIYYSREGRPYALFILLSTWLYAAFLAALRDGTARIWGLFGVLLLLCGLTHLLTFQLLLVFGLHIAVTMLIEGRMRFSRRSLLLLALAVAAGSSWGAYRFFGSRGDGIAMWRAFDGFYPFGPLAFFRTVAVNFGPGPVMAIFGPPAANDLLALVYVLCAGLGIARLVRDGRGELARFGGLLFAVPLAVSYITLGEKGAWDWARYISHLLVPFLLLAGLGLATAVSSLKSRAAQGGLFAIGLALMVPHALRLQDRAEYHTYSDMTAYLEQHQPDLKGVVVLSYLHDVGQADERITNIYVQARRDTLPIFQLTNGVFHPVELRPGRGGLGQVAWPASAPAGVLPSGAYALLARQPVTDCRQVEAWTGGRVVSSTPVQTSPGVTTCDLRFSE